jgi:hypothetical protein
MVDMSIGEAATASGRRPQFTQERSTTKKMPLKAMGCKDFLTIEAGLSTKQGSTPPSYGKMLTRLLGHR